MSVETVLDRIRRAKSSGGNAYVQATGSGSVKVAPAAPTVTAPASGVTASAAGSAAARDRVLDRIARSKTGGNTFVQVTPAGAVDVTARSKAARPDTVKIPTRFSDVGTPWDVGGVRDEVERKKLQTELNKQLVESLRRDIPAAEKTAHFLKWTKDSSAPDWLKEMREDAENRESELKALWKDVVGWEYGKYDDGNTSGATKTLNSILDFIDAAATSGVAQFTTGVANTGDLLIGRPLAAAGWENNPLHTGAETMNQYNDEMSRELMRAAGDSKAAQTAAQVLSGAVAAAPMAVMAFLTGGASAATTGALQATAASQGMTAAQSMGRVASQMMKNPNYWTSFIQDAGNNYREAKEWTNDDAKAAMYAITVGLINAGIEIGLDGASGIQGLEQSVRQGNTTGLRQLIDSAGGEALEELEQGVVSRGVGKLFGSGAPTLSTTDPNAVINLRTMASEAAMGGAVGALLTGGTYGVNSAIQRAYSNPLLEIYDNARSERAELAENNPILAAYDRAVQGDTATDTPTAAGQTNGAVGERAPAVAENNNAPEGVNAGRVTHIANPYNGETPTYTMPSDRVAPSIPSESISRAQNEINRSMDLANNQGKGFKSFLAKAYEALFNQNGGSRNVVVNGLTMDGEQYEVTINKNVVAKVISDKNLTPEKLAVFDVINDVVANGEYVGSGEYIQKTAKRKLTKRFDYFETPITIDGKNYIVAFDVEVYPDVNNYRTHKLINEMSLTAVNNADTGTGLPQGQRESSFHIGIVPQSTPNVNPDSPEQTAPGTDAAKAYHNIGAAEAGYSTPTRGTMAPTQNKTATQGIGLTEADRAAYAPEDHETVPERKSLEQAAGLFYEDENGKVVNIEDTVDGLLEKDAWTGVEQDAAQIAFRFMRGKINDLTPEQYSKFRALVKTMHEVGATEAGRSLQARQKWVESGDGIVEKTMSILEDPRIDPEAAKKVMRYIANLAERYDLTEGSGNIDDYFQIIREAALTRQTTKGASSQIKKTAEWAMKQIKAHGDTEFARNAARSSIIAMAQDQVPRSLSAQLKAARRDAMLSKISTWVRNVVSNNVFDPIDSIARDISVPMDWLLSKVTGTRSVGWDASWFSKAKKQGTKYGAARSFLEVALDINAEGAESRYGQTGNRTFKTTGNVFQRFMSQWEKVSNYAMYSTDQMQKGGIEAEVQHGIDRLYKKGKIADDSLRDAGAQEASFRTFQRDSAISKGLSTMRRGLNELAHVGDMGLGDILMPFVQVPANLVDITIDYSPLGFARGLYRLTDTLIDAHRGTMTAAQQARAVQTIGRSLTGTGVLALAVVAKMAGAFIISDDGRDEDKDKAALESQAGLTGTQINLSGLKRLFTGGSAKLQPGDTLMSISFMDPMNALLNMGGLIADDYLAEHEGEENGITLGEIFTDVSSGITQSLMDLPMMSPMADAAQAYQYSKADTEGGRWMDAAKQYAAGQVTSIIPNNLKGIVQGTDTKKRDLYSGQTLKEQTLDSVKSAIPGLRQQLPVKQNSFGEEMDTGDWWLNFLNNNILPGAVTQYTPQHPEITQWLDDLYSATGAVTQYPDKNPPNSISKDTDGDGKAEKFALNAEEKRQYQRTYGGIYEDLVGQIVDSQSMAFTPDELLDIMSGIKSYAGSQAKQEFYDERDVDTETSTNFITKAVAGVQEAGIPFVTYLDFWAKKGNLEYEVDEKGNRKVKEAVVELIDSMDLTPEQKDWLYLDAGYAKDSIGDTPWH